MNHVHIERLRAGAYVVTVWRDDKPFALIRQEQTGVVSWALERFVLFQPAPPNFHQFATQQEASDMADILKGWDASSTERLADLAEPTRVGICRGRQEAGVETPAASPAAATLEPPVKPRVKLSDEDGNAFAIIAACARAARKAKLKNWPEILKDLTAGDYDHLLQSAMKHFEVI